MVRCRYGHKKIKQDNCPRRISSQSTAPCPVIHLSIMFVVAHKRFNACKLASVSEGAGWYELNYNQHFQAQFSDLTMTNDLIH